MSSQDKSQKTELPTPRRLRELRKKGQVPKSKDVIATVNLTILFLFLAISLEWTVSLITELTRFASANLFTDFEQTFRLLVAKGLQAILVLTLPLAGITVVSIAIGTLMQTGWIFSLDPVTPDLNKLNPVNGLKRIFSKKSLMEAIKSFVKILFIGGVTALVVLHYFEDVLFSSSCGFDCMLETAWQCTAMVVLLSLLVFVAESLFDFWLQKHTFIEDNKMSREDIKKEMKNSEGDPQVKSERRSQQRQISASDIVRSVKEARVIILGGDSAIALYYQKGKTPLPLITLKERGAVAQKIHQLARQSGIEVVRDSTLCQRLWDDGKINQYIPKSTVEDLGKVFARLNKPRA